MDNNILQYPLQCVDGIYCDDIPRRRHFPAQASNFLKLTAQLYEPLWRYRSIGILTQGAYTTMRELELLQDWIQPQAGEKILDVACSAALYARTLLHAEPEVEVHAVDMSSAFLRQAKRAMQQRFTLVQADVQSLPYVDASFDAIVCGGSLNEFYDLDKAMQEMLRVLKPNGRMWQMYLIRSDNFWRQRIQDMMRLTGIRFLHQQDVESIALRYGMDVVKSQVRGDVVMTLFKKQVVG